MTVNDNKPKVGDIVKVLDNGTDGWEGCLVIVDEVRVWGIIGYAKIPCVAGDSWIRLNFNQLVVVGHYDLLRGE